MLVVQRKEEWFRSRSSSANMISNGTLEGDMYGVSPFQQVNLFSFVDVSSIDGILCSREEHSWLHHEIHLSTIITRVIRNRRWCHATEPWTTVVRRRQRPTRIMPMPTYLIYTPTRFKANFHMWALSSSRVIEYKSHLSMRSAPDQATALPIKIELRLCCFSFSPCSPTIWWGARAWLISVSADPSAALDPFPAMVSNIDRPLGVTCFAMPSVLCACVLVMLCFCIFQYGRAYKWQVGFTLLLFNVEQKKKLRCRSVLAHASPFCMFLVLCIFDFVGVSYLRLFWFSFFSRCRSRGQQCAYLARE